MAMAMAGAGAQLGANHVLAGASEAEAAPLRAMRDDLALFRGPAQIDGSPTWTLHDAVRNRYFRIGWAEFAILSRWAPVDAGALAAKVAAQTPLAVTRQEVEAVADFLDRNQLLAPGSARLGDRLAVRAHAARPKPFAWLLKNYLFIRIPLFRPDRFLDALMPVVRPLFSASFLWFLAGCLVAGLYLALRQWDQFVTTFVHFFSVEGAVFFALALMFAKVIHEMGHAFTAKRYGLRVPTMGVAFLVLWPVLYTDTSDAWRLPRRAPRLWIGGAGMIAELGLAILATLLWSFLPEGAFRGAVFMVASATWIMTLAVNLNPFMRFDGYYLLSDLTGIENLQDRAFRLARWRLREMFFAFGEASPELATPRQRRLMLVYAYATWIYRFFLFLGIALLVYHFAFKLLGIALMATEIAWFIGRPVVLEFGQWWRRRRAIGLNRNVILTFSGLALVVGLLAVPWRSAILAPAVLRPAEASRIFAETPARVALTALVPGRAVRAGEALVELNSPELDYDLRRAALRIAALEQQLARSIGDARLTERAPVLRRELAQTLTEAEGYRRQMANLRLTAPFDGVIAEVAEGLAPGRWVNADERLALVIDPRSARIEAYIAEDDLARVAEGQIGRFYDDAGAAPPLEVRLVAIDGASVSVLETAYLASTLGGPIAVRADADGALVPEAALYRIEARPAPATETAAEAQALGAMRRGWLRLDGAPQSLLERAWLLVAAVVIRESGF